MCVHGEPLRLRELFFLCTSSLQDMNAFVCLVLASLQDASRRQQQGGADQSAGAVGAGAGAGAGPKPAGQQ